MPWLVRGRSSGARHLAVIVGIIYLVEPIHSVPTFFPGHAAHGQTHHQTRGIPRNRRGHRLADRCRGDRTFPVITIAIAEPSRAATTSARNSRMSPVC
jgi:hypothetical protein